MNQNLLMDNLVKITNNVTIVDYIKSISLWYTIALFDSE